MSQNHEISATSAEHFMYLDALLGRGIRTDLGPMRIALGMAGNPQDRMPVVLVGGTNGKGSTATMIGEIIRHAEYNVGCYYSPHIVDVRERIAIHGAMISERDFAELVQEVRWLVEGRIELTYFEFLTLAAYYYFAGIGVDLAVMEVGMGGRFDATNVVDPLVSVITSVDLDHTQYLGKTREAIAREKAEIVHEGGTLIVGLVDEGVKAVLREHAQNRSARVYFFGDDFYSTVQSEGVMGYRGIGMTLDDLVVSMHGAHQAENAAVALAAFEVLTERGFVVSEEAVREGLYEVWLPGRIERIGEAPEVIADVAHNPGAAEVLAGYIETLPKRRTALVVGMMGDKDIEGFFQRIARCADALFLARLSIDRAAPLDRLTAAAKGLDIPVRPCENVREAMAAARNFVGSEGRIIVTGSFYTVEEAIKR